MLYSYLQHHKDTTIIKTDAHRKTHEGKRRKTSLEKYSPLTLLQGFERVVQGLHVRGWWRPNINFIFWPHCYDRHVVSFLFSWCWGPLHRGFSRAPSVGCGLPYHIWSPTLWNSTGDSIGGFLRDPSVRCGLPYHIWSLLSGSLLATALAPNSTQLYNNSTPTRSPTGSLKSNV